MDRGGEMNNLSGQRVWCAGRLIREHEDRLPEWDLAGVFSTEEAAVAACQDENYFVGPADIDKPFPTEPMPWEGGYYPMDKTLKELTA
jgi:hypothetical protein